MCVCIFSLHTHIHTLCFLPLYLTVLGFSAICYSHFCLFQSFICLKISFSWPPLRCYPFPLSWVSLCSAVSHYKHIIDVFYFLRPCRMAVVFVYFPLYVYIICIMYIWPPLSVFYFLLILLAHFGFICFLFLSFSNGRLMHLISEAFF